MTSSSLHAVLGCAYAAGGEHDRALEILRDTERRQRVSYVSAFYIALLHANLGHTDAAFAALERALEERDALLPWLKFFPAPDCVQLRSDPRFQAVLEHLGLG